MALYRQVFDTQNRWTFLDRLNARGAIEAATVSLLEPGDKVLVPVFGGFGHLLCEIADRCGALISANQHGMGQRILPDVIQREIKTTRPKMLEAIVQGDTSTTMLQPLKEIGEICREEGYCFIATRLHRLVVTS